MKLTKSTLVELTKLFIRAYNILWECININIFIWLWSNDEMKLQLKQCQSAEEVAQVVAGWRAQFEETFKQSQWYVVQLRIGVSQLIKQGLVRWRIHRDFIWRIKIYLISGQHIKSQIEFIVAYVHIVSRILDVEHLLLEIYQVSIVISLKHQPVSSIFNVSVED